jgi:hypothetical protein
MTVSECAGCIGRTVPRASAGGSDLRKSSDHRVHLYICSDRDPQIFPDRGAVPMPDHNVSLSEFRKEMITAEFGVRREYEIGL